MGERGEKGKEKRNHLNHLGLTILYNPALIFRNYRLEKDHGGAQKVDTSCEANESNGALLYILLKNTDCCLIFPENGEDIQVLRYEPRQKYDPHYDYFTDKVNVARGGHRIATVLMYLSDVEKGGETVFPNAEVSSYTYAFPVIFTAREFPQISTKY